MTFSVIIPTLNESARIAQTLAAARAALGESAEYIVSDGGSTDATCAIAEQSGALVVTGARGRGAQLDAALRVAQGDICIFVHADTLLPLNARFAIEQAMRKAVGGAFYVKFENNELPCLARSINMRSRLFRTATGDQAIFARRDVLLAVGGIPRIQLFEDVRLWQKLKRAGRLELARAHVTTSARLWKQAGTWRVILLHLRFRALHALGVSPDRLARRYPTSGS